MSLFMPTQLVSNHLGKVYQVAKRDIAQLASARTLAEQAKKHSDDRDKQIDWLIKREGRKAGASGFVTGVSGASLSVVSLPANFASVTYLQMRLATAIAYLHDMDLDDKDTGQKVADLVAGTSVDVPRGGAVQAGKAITSRLLGGVPKKALKKVNEASGKKVLHKGKTGEEALDAPNTAKGALKGKDAKKAKKTKNNADGADSDSGSADQAKSTKPVKKTRAQKHADKKQAKADHKQAKADQKQAKKDAKKQQRGLLDITRLVPIVGGVVGGVLDAQSTQKVGTKARKQFTQG